MAVIFVFRQTDYFILKIIGVFPKILTELPLKFSAPGLDPAADGLYDYTIMNG